jgi:putative transcriptional regulator
MFNDLIPFNTGVEPSAGALLISEPLLLDSNFQRSVILLCHHDINESMGFVLNKLATETLSDLVPEMANSSFPVYQGGPVGLNSLHFIHTLPDLLQGSHLAHGIFWSGDIARAFEGIKMGEVNEQNCRFFVGYSGWGAGQLDAELDMNSWLVCPSSQRLVFDVNQEQLWKESVEELGPKFKNLLFIPNDPTLN